MGEVYRRLGTQQSVIATADNTKALENIESFLNLPINEHQASTLTIFFVSLIPSRFVVRRRLRLP